MGKLSEIFAKIKEKLKSMSTAKKIASLIILSVVVILLWMYGSYTSANKYGILFSNLSSDDGKTISDKLTALKVDKKIEGNTIYVPKGQVDELRLELAGDLSSGSKGYELLDNTSSFGQTDEEYQMTKLRAIQGELERTIKSFSQIENARVHVTPSEDSVFVKDSKPAKAAVYVQLKPGAKLSADNVKSIIALVSGGVPNLPQENVDVIDDKMNLLSKGVLDGTNVDDTATIEKSQDLEVGFEKKLETALMDMLEPAIGKNKVNVKVNADLDFDSQEKTVITYDPNKVEESTQSSKETDTTPNGSTSGSPTDVNTNPSNTTPSGSGNNVSSKESSTINYKVGQTENKVISAPGEVKRITASVIVDGKIDDQTKTDLTQLVAGVIGYKADRGDQINIVGMAFDQTGNAQAQSEIKAMQDETNTAKKYELYKTIGIGAAGFAVFVVLLILLLKSRKRNKKEELSSSSIDVVIGGEVPVKESIKFEPLIFDVPDEKSHLEQEIKKYATEKPEQVADIIKSWLTEDER